MKKILLTLSIISIFNYVLASETESLSDTESISSQQTDTEEIDIPINIITKLVELAKNEHEEREFLEKEITELETRLAEEEARNRILAYHLSSPKISSNFRLSCIAIIATQHHEIDEYEKLKSELEAQKRSNRIWKIATAASAIVGIGCALLAKSLFNALKEKATTVVFAPTINLISK
ncbi:hypothetical protein A3F66_04530 [candidate division TM6 bacterium RIFCSPHIGHO2_12_FULL_32_22]|nr:MAG: hypothetical protein A3F66_04530 [candidate division TM6 bacterium RIFCSPHIGHO2_12_FULL_32_22]